jgi:hypothetical protein
MREFDQAVGRLCACLSAAGAEFQFEQREGAMVMTVRGEMGHVDVIGRDSDGYFTVARTYRPSLDDRFDLTEGATIEEFQRDFFPQIREQLPMNGVSMAPLSTNQNGVEYFDGIRGADRLYVYEDEFSASDFDEVVRRVVPTTMRAWSLAVDELGLELREETVETEAPPAVDEVDTRSFQ